MKRCKYCGAYLDPGEKCDCGGKPPEKRPSPGKLTKRKQNTARIDRAYKEWMAQ